MIRPKSKRFTNNIFKVVLRTMRPLPLVAVKDKLQPFYSMKLRGRDLIDGVEELERQGKVTLIREHGQYFTEITVELSPLQRLAAL